MQEVIYECVGEATTSYQVIAEDAPSAVGMIYDKMFELDADNEFYSYAIAGPRWDDDGVWYAELYVSRAHTV